jgi:hypothetical protein
VWESTGPPHALAWKVFIEHVRLSSVRTTNEPHIPMLIKINGSQIILKLNNDEKMERETFCEDTIERFEVDTIGDYSFSVMKLPSIFLEM